MILLISYFFNIKDISISSLLIYLLSVSLLFLLNKNIFLFVSIMDIYIHTLTNNFNIINYKKKSNKQLGMEIVTESNSKSKPTNISDIMVDYCNKFIT